MGRASTIAEPWKSLADKLGSVGRMATELQSARRTVNQWANGERLPSRLTQVFIVATFIKYGVEPPNF
jgi:Ni/Co efflux regulator RcnB